VEWRCHAGDAQANIYETKSQRRETEVKRLLEKIPADLITMNPDEILG
jgi:U3 small nucleolar RNA-associated protein 7